MTCGIYMLSALSGNFYIGSSRNIRRRTRTHERDAEAGVHGNSKLQRAYDKYRTLEKRVLIVCRPGDLLMYEQLCIDALRPEYNCSKIAGKIEMTPRVRALIGATHKGKTMSPESRAKIAAAGIGRVPTQATREKLAAARRGVKVSDEIKAKISATKKGRSLSAETRARMSASRMGHKVSEETRAKLRASSSRPERIARTKEVHTGKIVSAETRARLSASGKATAIIEGRTLRCKPTF